MQLNRKSFWVRYIYFGDAKPNHTTLCRMFWYGLFKSGLYLFFLSAVASVLIEAAMHIRAALAITGALTATIIIGVVLAQLEERRTLRRRDVYLGLAPKKKSGVIAEAFYGIKHKVCPIVDIVD